MTRFADILMRRLSPSYLASRSDSQVARTVRLPPPRSAIDPPGSNQSYINQFANLPPQNTATVSASTGPQDVTRQRFDDLTEYLSNSAALKESLLNANVPIKLDCPLRAMGVAKCKAKGFDNWDGVKEHLGNHGLWCPTQLHYLRSYTAYKDHHRTWELSHPCPEVNLRRHNQKPDFPINGLGSTISHENLVLVFGIKPKDHTMEAAWFIGFGAFFPGTPRPLPCDFLGLQMPSFDQVTSVHQSHDTHLQGPPEINNPDQTFFDPSGPFANPVLSDITTTGTAPQYSPLQSEGHQPAPTLDSHTQQPFTFPDETEMSFGIPYMHAETCNQSHVDFPQTPLPVEPGADYNMSGVSSPAIADLFHRFNASTSSQSGPRQENSYRQTASAGQSRPLSPIPRRSRKTYTNQTFQELKAQLARANDSIRELHEKLEREQQSQSSQSFQEMEAQLARANDSIEKLEREKLEREQQSQSLLQNYMAGQQKLEGAQAKFDAIQRELHEMNRQLPCTTWQCQHFQTAVGEVIWPPGNA